MPDVVPVAESTASKNRR